MSIFTPVITPVTSTFHKVLHSSIVKKIAAWPVVRRLKRPEYLAVALITLTPIFILLDRIWEIARRAYFQAFYFSGYPIDGTFQLFNPLRRLNAGQVPGVDLQFFHGLGTLLVHFPLFHLFGGNLAASELSREIISPLFFLVSAGVLLYVTTRKWLGVFTGLGILLLFFPFMPMLVISSNSLLGVRSTVPLLVGASIILMMRSRENPRRFLVTKATTLALLAVAFFMSVEQGVAAIVAYAVVETLFGKGGFWKRMLYLARDMAVVAAMVLACFIATSGSRFMDPIYYALKELPGDQFWYFGAPPNEFLHSIWSVFANQFLITCWLTAVVLWVIFLRWRDQTHSSERFGYLYLLTYGAITTVSIFGIENEAYFQPLLRIVLLTLIGFGFIWAQETARKNPKFFVQPAIGIAVILALININMPQDLQSGIHVGDFTAGTTLGAHLNKHWQQYVDILHKTVPKGASLWSTYSSIPEAEAGIFNPSGYDYIIHALGPVRRRQYVESFIQAKTDYAQTVRRDFTDYEGWLQMEHWDWYEWLATNYSPAAITPHSVFWKRHNDIKNPNDVPWLATVNNPAQDAVISLDKLPKDLPDNTIVTVEVSYQARSVFKAIPLVGNLPRFLIYARGSNNELPVSLPPYETTWRFPVAVKHGQVPKLDPRIESLVPGGRFKIKSVRYRVLPVDQKVADTLQGHDLPLFSDK